MFNKTAGPTPPRFYLRENEGLIEGAFSFNKLVDYEAAVGTMDVETVGVIWPSADLGAFFGEDIVTPGTTIIVLAEAPSGQEFFQKIHGCPHDIEGDSASLIDCGFFMK